MVVTKSEKLTELKANFLGMVSGSRIRYLVVGGSGFLLEYGAFWLLITVKVGVLPSNAGSFLVGFLYTFTLHNAWSFAGEHTNSLRRQFASYVLLAGVNIVATTVAIGVLTHMGVPPLLAKLLCMGMVVLWNYLLLNRVIFKRH